MTLEQLHKVFLNGKHSSNGGFVSIIRDARRKLCSSSPLCRRQRVIAKKKTFAVYMTTTTQCEYKTAKNYTIFTHQKREKKKDSGAAECGELIKVIYVL